MPCSQGISPVGGNELCIHGCTMQTLMAEEAEVTEDRLLPLTPRWAFTLQGGVPAHILTSHPNTPSRRDLHQKQTQGAEPDLIREQL